MSVALIQGLALFSSEVAEAKRLGFELQANNGQLSVAARAQPVSEPAVAACTRASGKQGQAIEAVRAIESEDQRLDALRDCIKSVLTMANEVMA